MKHTYSFIILGMVTFIMSYSTIVQSATSVEEANKIKTIIEQVLNPQAEMNTVLSLEGDVTVVPDGQYYAITLPHISLNAHDGRKLDIGVIKANTSSIENDLIAVNLLLPTPMVLYNTDGSAQYELSIGQQNFSGTFYPDLLNFTNLKALYKNIKITTLDPNALQGSLFINSISSIIDFNKGANGYWSGPKNASAQGITMQVESEDNKIVKLSIDSVESLNAYHDMDIDKALAYSKRMQSLAKEVETNPEKKPTPEELKAMTADAFKIFQAMFDGLDSSFNINNISLQSSDAIDTKSAYIDTIGGKAHVEGFRGNNLKITSDSFMKNLNISGLPEDISALVPKNINIDINIFNVPIQSVLSLSSEAIIENMGTSEKPESSPVPMESLMQIVQLMGNAGSTLKIENTFTDMPALHTTLSGEARADVNAEKNAVADFTLKFAGIDELVTKYQQDMKLGLLSPNMKGPLGGLTMLQMMGQEETDETGKSARSYHLELTSDGQLLLNGSDMGMMMGMMGGIPGTQPSRALTKSEPTQQIQ